MARDRAAQGAVALPDRGDKMARVVRVDVKEDKAALLPVDVKAAKAHKAAANVLADPSSPISTSGHNHTGRGTSLSRPVRY